MFILLCFLFRFSEFSKQHTCNVYLHEICLPQIEYRISSVKRLKAVFT